VLVRFLLLFSMVFSVVANASERIVLDGHISSSVCEEVRTYLKTEPYEKERKIDFVLSSTSGDLQEVLSLARFLAKIRKIEGLEYTAYIKDQCIGPLALLPFVCDTVVTTAVVSWGAITLDSNEKSPLVIDAEIRALILPPSRCTRKELNLFTCLWGAVKILDRSSHNTSLHYTRMCMLG